MNREPPVLHPASPCYCAAGFTTTRVFLFLFLFFSRRVAGFFCCCWGVLLQYSATWAGLDSRWCSSLSLYREYSDYRREPKQPRFYQAFGSTSDLSRVSSTLSPFLYSLTSELVSLWGWWHPRTLVPSTWFNHPKTSQEKIWLDFLKPAVQSPQACSTSAAFPEGRRRR